MNTTVISNSNSSTNLNVNNLSSPPPPSSNYSIDPVPSSSRKSHHFVTFFLSYMEYLRGLLVALLIAGLKASGRPIPRHVALIMDGNRRYAKKKGFKHVSEGHFEGARALETLLDHAFRLGINTITVYAFSIENFKRPAEEVNVLMSLAAEKLHILSQQSELIKKHQVRINVLGALHLLPRHVQVSAAQAMLSTIHNENYILNICFPYTSSHEITEACKRALQYAHETPNSLPIFESQGLFDCFLDTWDSPPLDILIRTSGEARLSEFLMWQVCRGNSQTGKNTQVHILDALWPEFGFSHLLSIIIKFQSASQNLSRIKSHKLPSSNDIDALKSWRRIRKIESLQKIISSNVEIVNKNDS